MKKLILIILLTVGLFTTGFSQTGKYVSAGISGGKNSLTYALEGGIYRPKAWYAIVGEHYTHIGVDNDQHDVNYLGGKAYYKVAKLDKILDVYTYGAVKLGLTTGHPVQYEPGISPVFNLSPSTALQFSISAPIEQHKVSTSMGLGFNFYF
jgi:hypothetical protein